MSEKSPAPLVIGIDTGGTFTDFFAALPDGRVLTHKRLSTPHDPGTAVLEGLDSLLDALATQSPSDAGSLSDRSSRIVHGSTVATNAVLERKGARTAFVTTRGFRDMLHIGRQARRELYNLMPQEPAPLLPRDLCFEVTERVDVEGDVVTPLDQTSVDEMIASLRAADVESVALVFLHSFTYPEHERHVAKILRAQGWFVSPSHEILPEHREFERASTTALNAYVSPLMDRYLSRLNAAIAGERGLSPLRIMQSSGGVTDARHAGAHGVQTILSGPAGGVVGAHNAAVDAGASHIITFDMGGTSTDVSLVPGELMVTAESEIEGFPVRVPVLDIHTVGAGGGSIARFDSGGALRVGPESAGADPGPASYGRGGTAFTVTDADLVLGRLPQQWFMGGRMALDTAAAGAACRTLARAMDAAEDDIAYGVIEVVRSNMERAVKVISVERGFDPRHFCLVSFGGAGSLHACELARSLSIPTVLIPSYPGVLSAKGMAVADVVKTSAQGILGPLDEERIADAQKAARTLIERASGDLRAEGVPPEAHGIHVSVDLRYSRQSFELALPCPRLVTGSPQRLLTELPEAFHAEHERHYGHSHPDESIEIVAVKVRAEGRVSRPPATRLPQQSTRQRPEPVLACTARFASGRVETPVYRRADLQAEAGLTGPAIVVEDHATTVILPGDTLVVHPSGALLITVGAGA